jgi:hypothetical protein
LGVFQYDCELAVVEAELGAVVDVAAAADCDAVVDDEELGDVVLAIVLLCMQQWNNHTFPWM